MITFLKILKNNNFLRWGGSWFRFLDFLLKFRCTFIFQPKQPNKSLKRPWECFLIISKNQNFFQNHLHLPYFLNNWKCIYYCGYFSFWLSWNLSILDWCWCYGVLSIFSLRPISCIYWLGFYIKKKNFVLGASPSFFFALS